MAVARRSTAGRLPVKEVMGVRISPCQQLQDEATHHPAHSAGILVVWSRWLARHPVKVEIAGSSPVTTAALRHTRVAQWQSARPTSGRSQAHFLPRVPRSCGETEIMPDYGSGVGGSSPSGSAHGL